MPEKIPPHNKEAEQAALGAALINKDALADVLDMVKAEDFYNGAHQEIFKSIVDLASKDKAVDILSVCEDLSRKGSLDLAGGRAYIADLPATAPVTTNAKEYATIVSEKATLRALIKAADDIKGSSFDEELDAKFIKEAKDCALAVEFNE